MRFQHGFSLTNQVIPEVYLKLQKDKIVRIAKHIVQGTPITNIGKLI